MFREAMRAACRGRRDRDAAARVQAAGAARWSSQLGDVDVDGKRVVAAFVGWEGGDAPFEVHPTLEAGVCAAARAAPPDVGELEARASTSGARGGAAARPVLRRLARPRGRHDPRAGARRRSAATRATAARSGHAIFDLGEEEYTQGRPHPMIDLEVRLEMLERAAGEAGLGCVLLDVVIGHGSHADPAGGLAPALAPLAATARSSPMCAAPPADPQDGEPPGRDAARGRRDRRAHERRRRAAGREGARMRIAMLTYSVKPRGGVVHALEVAEALARRGHDVELLALARPGDGLFRPTARAAARSSATCRRTRVRRAHRRDARGLHGRAAADPRRRRLRRRALAGLPVGQRGARAARRGRDRPRDPHRPPRRRLHVAVADRVPGPLDHRARPRALRVARRGSSGCAASSASTAGLVRQRGRRAPLPPARATPPSAPRARARPASASASRSSPSAASSRARARCTLLEAFARLRAALPERDPLLLIAGGVDAVRLPPRARPLRRARAPSSA